MARALLVTLAALVLAAPATALASGGGDKKPAPKPSYLSLSTVSASIARRNGRRGVLAVEVGLDAQDGELRERLELYQPVLRSAYLSALQPYAMGLSPGAPPNTDYITRVLQKETDRVLGRQGAKVLLGSVLVY